MIIIGPVAILSTFISSIWCMIFFPKTKIGHIAFTKSAAHDTPFIRITNPVQCVTDGGPHNWLTGFTWITASHCPSQIILMSSLTKVWRQAHINWNRCSKTPILFKHLYAISHVNAYNAESIVWFVIKCWENILLALMNILQMECGQHYNEWWNSTNESTNILSVEYLISPLL